ncbi:uncharacterized protein LOC123298786 [Chrysoperla carnea]|uniref:uncharacterized protein LOC123298786 n=1 Tax=Chrysoperla carnea TaxID=189513 RepID=UPI001D06E71C|nr:uncharacterized protein LOC123298786 [Chrysoperla carnea]
MELWNSSFIFKSILVFVLFSSICYCSGATIGAKVKRGGNNWGIYPHPRVGRSGIYSRIQSPHELYDSSDYFHEMKRQQSLMAFPRVGRDSQSHTEQNAMNAPEQLNGLWWGPRLGRFQKRGPELTDTPWGFVSAQDGQKWPRGTDFTPRLGRDSEELLDDDDLDETNRTVDKPLKK